MANRKQFSFIANKKKKKEKPIANSLYQTTSINSE